MIIVAGGSRDFDDPGTVHMVLTGLYAELQVGKPSWEFEKFHVIDGGCPTGADLFIREWCESSPMHHPVGFPEQNPHFFHDTLKAMWDQYGNKAGPIRNELMLEKFEPDLVLIFVNKPIQASDGSHDLWLRAQTRKIETITIERWLSPGRDPNQQTLPGL